MNASGQIMNCEDYREAIAADPSESFEGGAAHVAACDSCNAYRAEMRTLDDVIARALAIDVPELKIPDLPAIGEDDENVVNLPFRRAANISIACLDRHCRQFCIGRHHRHAVCRKRARK